jgi:hypothetical protein
MRRPKSVIVDIGARGASILASNRVGIYTYAVNQEVDFPYGGFANESTKFKPLPLMGLGQGGPDTPRKWFSTVALAVRMGLKYNLPVAVTPELGRYLDEHLNNWKHETGYPTHNQNPRGVRKRTLYIGERIGDIYITISDSVRSDEQWVYAPFADSQAIVAKGIKVWPLMSDVCISEEWIRVINPYPHSTAESIFEAGHWAGLHPEKFILARTPLHWCERVESSEYVLSGVRGSSDSWSEAYQINFVKPDFALWNSSRSHQLDLYQESAVLMSDVVGINSALDMNGMKDVVFFSNYALCNSSNKLDDVIAFIQQNEVICNFPNFNGHYAISVHDGCRQFIKRKMGLDLAFGEGGILITELHDGYRDQVYEDHTLRNTFSADGITIVDSYCIPMVGFDRGTNYKFGINALTSNWMWLVSDRLMPNPTGPQTIYTNVVHHVKFGSHMIQRVLGMLPGDQYLIRKVVVELLGGIPDFEMIGGGDGWTSDKSYYMYLSGHLIGLLIMSLFTFVPLDTYLKIIKHNVAMYSKDRTAYRYEQLALRRDILYKEAGFAGIDSLWHSYLEVIGSLHAACEITEMFGIDSKNYHTPFFERVNAILLQYKSFADLSTQAKRDANRVFVNSNASSTQF